MVDVMGIAYVYGWFDSDECFYIGISEKPERKSYVKDRNKFCLNKYNKAVKKETFQVRVLHSGLSWEMACWYEISYIRAIGRRDLGLGSLTNLTNGGDGVKGLVHSEETKLKIADSNREMWQRPEIIEKMKLRPKQVGADNGMYGKTHSPETILQMSETRRGEGNGMYGKTHTPEARQRISEAQLGKRYSPEARQKMSETRKGRKHSPDTIEKMKGRTPHNLGKGIPVHTPEGIFPNARMAGEAINLTEATVKGRCKSKNPLYAEYYQIREL